MLKLRLKMCTNGIKFVGGNIFLNFDSTGTDVTYDIHNIPMIYV